MAEEKKEILENVLFWLQEKLANELQQGIHVDIETLMDAEREPDLQEIIAKNKEAAEMFQSLRALLHELAETEELEKLATTQPDKFMMLIDKVTSSIYAPDVELLDAGTGRINVGKGGKKPVVRLNVASIADKDNVKVQGKLTPYDKQVQNAVVTLWYEGYITITAALVYSRMTGGKRGQDVQLELVTKSIDKQRMIDVHIDAREEVKMFGYKCEKAVLKNNLLSAKGITVESGGHKVDAYMLLDEPILYSYAKLSNYKIASIPAELIDIKELDSSGKLTAASIQDTPDRITIKNALIQRIQTMKNDEKTASEKYNTYLSRPTKNNEKKTKTLATFRHMKQRKINFDNLFKEVKIDINNRSTAKRYRDYCFQCLDYWQAKGEFKSWEQYKDGRKIMGVEIIF